MNKRYEIKAPRSHYIQMFGLLVILTSHTLVTLYASSKEATLLYTLKWVMIFFIVVIIITQIYLLLRFGREITITPERIITKQSDIPVTEIEKIIIQGYFIESIGIKRIGKKLIQTDLHFRFKEDEEKHLEELKKWAQLHGIPVVRGRIIKWL